MPPAVAAALCLFVLLLLVWPLPLGLSDHYLYGRFTASHVWFFDQVSQMLTGATPWSTSRDRVGFPGTYYIPIIGWSAALVAGVLTPLMGPFGAFSLVQILSPVAATLAAYALIRRVTEAPAWTASACSLLFGLSPTVLGSLANSQIAKVQHWVLPLALLALLALLRGPRLWAPLCAWVLVIVAGSFSGPDYVLHLSVLLVPWILWELSRAGADVREGAGRGLLAMVSAGLAVAPSWYYYDAGLHPGVIPAVAPATPVAAGVSEIPCPVADPLLVLFGGTGGGDPLTAVHVAYLGIPALVALALLGRRRGRGASLGWLTLLLGVCLALGPWLASSGRYVTIAGLGMPLPAMLLELVHHPIARSGMYYRFMVSASLGLALVAAAGLSSFTGLSSRLRLALAWGLVAVLVGDSLWETRALWPRPIRPLTAWTLDRLMAEDPVPGAVLELPFGPWDVDVPEAVMASAVIHKRRTTGLPRSTMGLQAEERLLSWLNLAAQAASPCAARAALAARGVRYMVWRDPKPDAPPRLTWLEEAFGPGAVIDGERYWTLEAPGEGCRD